MRSRKRTTFFLITAIIGFVILFHYIGWLQSVEVFLRRIISPGSQMVYGWSISVGDETEAFDSVASLEDAYTKLKEASLSHATDAVALQLLREENQSLRELLHFAEQTPSTMIGADVIGKNIDPIGSSLIINVGSSEGVAPGNPVIVGDGILIGKISRVTPETALVRLLDDNQSKVAGTILNEQKSIGVIEGGYGLSIRMNVIPQNEAIAIGDIVITSGLEEGVRRGLVIGVIESFEKEPYQPFQSAVVVPPKDFGKVRTVSIILNAE